MKRVCVFCGANSGSDPRFTAAALEVGRTLAARQIELVYGGGNVGLMGAVANSALSAGGKVIGVIPKMFIDREQAHTGLSDLRIVGSMHERKALMEDLADGFVALPGGLGTLEEFFEISTWAQLGLHRKPFGILNVAGFFTPLLQFLDHAIAQGFLFPQYRNLIIVEEDCNLILDRFEKFKAPAIPAWLSDVSET